MRGADELIFVVNVCTELPPLPKSVLGFGVLDNVKKSGVEMFTELGKVGSPPARRRFTGQIRGERQKNFAADPET